MIGQRDPFSEYSREFDKPREGSPQIESVPGYDTDPAPRFDALRDGGRRADADPVPGYDTDPAPPVSHEPGPPDFKEHTLQYGSDELPRSNDDYPPPTGWPNTSAAAQSYSADPFVPASQYQPTPGEHHDDSRFYVDPRHQPAIDDHQPDRLAFANANYETAPDRPDFSPPFYPHEPEAGSMPAPHDDEFYDDAPGNKRRKGLLTVVAVLALAVIGTAGAFGYRSLFHGAKSSLPPPVIRASSEPSKVAPPPSNADASANKFSYDRFGDRDQNERLVERQEAPVDAKDIGRTNVPRAALLGAPISGGPGSAAPSLGGAPVNTNPPSVLGEPRRVRTVPIRPDRPDPAGAPQVAAAETASASAASTPAAPLPPRRTNVASASPGNPPLQVTPEPMDAAPSPAASRASANRTASRSTPRPSALPEPRANAPLSLSPDRVSAPPPSARAAAAPRMPSAPARLASAPTGSGSYLVQVSSRRSEAEAEAAFRSIQARYSSVLSGHQHVIKRADLGGRGVYYRAMVGPFATRNEAMQFCGGLKAAGGDCIVQSN
jgi:hypothetical protein